MQNRAVLTTEEAHIRSSRPILLIDKDGTLGSLLSVELSKDFLVVYAGREKVNGYQRVVNVPYKKKFLQIPDNNFSHVILNISEDKEGSDLLLTLANKARVSSARLILILPLSFHLKLLPELNNISKIHPVTCIVTGDIYGTGTGRVDTLFHNAKINEKIVLLNDGLKESYPVFIRDVLQNILKILILTENTTHTFLLMQGFPTNDLAIARSIVKTIPDVKVLFKKKKVKEETLVIPEGKIVELDTTLDDGVRQLDKEFIAPKKQKKSKKDNNTFKKYIFLVIILILLLPFALTTIFAGVGILIGRSGIEELKSGRLSTAERRFVISKNSFTLASETSKSVEGVLGVLGRTREGKKITATIKSGEQLAGIGEAISQTGINYQKVLTGISKDPADDSQKGSQSLRRALTQLQVLKTESDTPEVIKKEINKNSGLLDIVNSLSEILPELLGVAGERKYLFVFQNNMELRPGGGFIGSYAVLSFNNGKIGDLVINDIYDADGKLKGHVDPPYALRRFGGIKHWYLRDSNFHVDFKENAEKSIYFLELETGEKVDGVIAIDTEVLKTILKFYGPLNMPQYNQTVTDKNIVMLTQSESQDEFFPGSTQKKDFLNALKKQLQQKVGEGTPPYESILKELQRLLDEKHIMVTLKDEGEQKILNSADVSGSILKQEKGNSVNDYLYINEANIGGTKGNQYLKREIIHNVRFVEQGKIIEEVKILYNNTSSPNSKFGGGYIGYLQIVLPENSVIASIAIDNRILEVLPAVTDPEVYEAINFRPNEGVEITSERFGNKNIFGFPIAIPTSTKRQITINYSITSKRLDLTSYSLHTIKQPGTLNDPYYLRIYYPADKKLSKSNLKDKASWAEYKGNLTTDLEFNLLFDK